MGEEGRRGRYRRSRGRGGAGEGARGRHGRIPAGAADHGRARHARRAGEDARVDRRRGEGERGPARRAALVDRRAARGRHRADRDRAQGRAGAPRDPGDGVDVRPRDLLHGEHRRLARRPRTRRVPDVPPGRVRARHGGDARHRHARRVAARRGAEGHASREPRGAAHLLGERRRRDALRAHRQDHRGGRGAARHDGEDAGGLRLHAGPRRALSRDDGRLPQRPRRMGRRPRPPRQDRARGRAEADAAGVTAFHRRRASARCRSASRPR